MVESYLVVSLGKARVLNEIKRFDEKGNRDRLLGGARLRRCEANLC